LKQQNKTKINKKTTSRTKDKEKKEQKRRGLLSEQ